MTKTTKARLRRTTPKTAKSPAKPQPESDGLVEIALDPELSQEAQKLALGDEKFAEVDLSDSKKIAGMEQALQKLLEWVVKHDASQVEPYVKSMRDKFPDLNNEALARKMLTKASLQAGAAGFVTGMGGVLALPVTVPANILLTWRIQAIMIIRMAYLFGTNQDKEEVMRDVLMVMAGDAGKEALKTAGVMVGKHWTKKAVDTLITKQTMNLIWKVVPRTVITKAGQKSLLSFTRMVPGVGGVIGFGFEWTYAQMIGRRSIAYYRDGI